MSFSIGLHNRDKWVQAQTKTENCDHSNSIFKLPAHCQTGKSSIYQRPYEHIQETRGFTLLELIVVCTLIGIMLTISVPSLRSAFSTNPLKSTARQVVGVINEVRQTAVRNQEPYHLYISQLENRIWYEKAEDEKKDAIEDDSDTPEKESYSCLTQSPSQECGFRVVVYCLKIKQPSG